MLNQRHNREKYMRSNFTFKNNLAYTEDNVLVYNIFAKHFGGQINADLSKNYFSKFGEITHITFGTISKEYKRKEDTVAHTFISFKEATAAANVLRTIRHDISFFKWLLVQPAYTWKQPNVETLKSLPSDMMTENLNGEPKVDLASLNDYCLEAVCRKLSLKDRINFAMTCERWTNIFISFFKTDYKSFDLFELKPLTLWQRRLFFQMMGTYIIEVKGQPTYKIIDFISLHCTNLKALKVLQISFKNQKVLKLLQLVTGVKELSLIDCSVNDNSILDIQFLDSLEALSLAHNDSMTGLHISTFRNLKRLNLFNCYELSTSNFIEICKCLNLLELDVRNCPDLAAPAFQALADHQNALEVLKCDTKIQPIHIIKLPALRSLTLNGSGNELQLLLHLQSMHSLQLKAMSDAFFDALANKIQLQYLHLSGGQFVTVARAEKIACIRQLKELHCPNNFAINDHCMHYLSRLENLETLNVSHSLVTDRGILRVLSICTKLKYIDVQNCLHITNQFYCDAIEILQKRGTSKIMLEVKVYATGIEEDDWNKYISAGKCLLRLDFSEVSYDALPDF